jgi:hypothetical protein
VTCSAVPVALASGDAVTLVPATVRAYQA